MSMLVDPRDLDLRIDMGSVEEVAWVLQRELVQCPVVLTLVYDGEPVSKGRPRMTVRGGHATAYTPDRTRKAEATIAALARQQVTEPDGEKTYGIFAKFFAGTWQRRDVDNMLKLVSDALTGIVWDDDSQVSEMSAAVQRGVDDPRSYVLVYETPANRAPTTTCGVCGKTSKAYKSHNPKYCSRECSAEAQRRQVELTCLQCARAYQMPMFRAERIKKPFCSEDCRYLAQRYVAPCEVCGVTVSKPKSWAKGKHITCSRACADTLQTGRPRGLA